MANKSSQAFSAESRRMAQVTQCTAARSSKQRCASPAWQLRSGSLPSKRIGQVLTARKRQKLCAVAVSSARATLDLARLKFDQGDRMGALRQLENATRQPLSPQERREALYGATVVHASFGDVEQAQMSLRESLEAGLDFEGALKDEGMLKWRSSPQVLSQLKKFAWTLKQIREAVNPDRLQVKVGAPTSDGVDYAASEARLPKPNPNMSLSEMLRTDITGMDATVTGIVRRVLALLVVGLLLGTLLFYAGLEFAGIAR